MLQLAAKGYSYQDIAELLQVKVSTVGSFTRRMYQKLSVHSRSEAVFEANADEFNGWTSQDGVKLEAESQTGR